MARGEASSGLCVGNKDHMELPHDYRAIRTPFAFCEINNYHHVYAAVPMENDISRGHCPWSGARGRGETTLGLFNLLARVSYGISPRY